MLCYGRYGTQISKPRFGRKQYAGKIKDNLFLFRILRYKFGNSSSSDTRLYNGQLLRDLKLHRLLFNFRASPLLKSPSFVEHRLRPIDYNPRKW